MDGRRPAEGVTSDSALDREIEAALAVDPSPEFVAKVRARVASEPAPSPWWQFRWPVLAAAAAAAAVGIVVALAWQPAAPEQTATRGGADVVLSAPTPGLPAPQVTTERPVAPTVRSSPVIVARASSRTSRPVGRTLSGPSEVLISRDEQRAFVLLVTAVQEGRFPRALGSTANGPDILAEPMDISITPLVIEPLPQIAALGGEEQ
jgi:hypothetical protein